MTADTYSSILGVLLMGTGNDSSAWGDNCNNSVFTILEAAIAKKATHAVTGGTLDQSASPPPAAASQVVEMIHVFTGTLTSTQTWIVPNLSKVFLVDNRCTGAFGLLVKTTSGTAVNVPAGKMTLVVCDGANTMIRDDREDVGKKFEGFGTTVPGGEFECDGATKLIADYPDLYARIGTIWGGNGTTNFILPDLKTAGRFTRSRSGSVAVGTLQAADIAAHNHTATATTTTTGSTDSQGNHTHTATVTVTDPGHFHTYGGPGGSGVYAGSSGGFVSSPTSSSVTGISVGVTNSTTGAHTHTLTLSSSTSVTVNNSSGSETRPINASVLMTIKY